MKSRYGKPLVNGFHLAIGFYSIECECMAKKRKYICVSLIILLFLFIGKVTCRGYCNPEQSRAVFSCYGAQRRQRSKILARRMRACVAVILYFGKDVHSLVQWQKKEKTIRRSFTADFSLISPIRLASLFFLLRHPVHVVRLITATESGDNCRQPGFRQEKVDTFVLKGGNH